ncbi:peptidase domain-containing ABC transporter [Azotosporobacter soli]|uniref:peptidase domain-containing ABC transporter n=1 Tax=Azotosporobacter soli TaxID=3055040 RepID=UPI0031FF2E3E
MEDETIRTERETEIRKCLAVVAADLGIRLEAKELAELAAAVVQRKDTLTAIKQAVRKVGLKAQEKKTGPRELENLALPALFIAADGRCKVIRQVNGESVMLFDPAASGMLIKSAADFAAENLVQSLVFQRLFSLKDIRRQLNLTWFIPIIIRYKRYFGEIIGAAFLFQLFGLAIPLCTQVMIDKVIVQQGEATLLVLGVGLLFTALFRSVMNMIRTYLFTHTTNKIDVILGSRMFRHLMRLPLRFFEARRVGDTLMRVAALTYVREFLTGTAMTVLIDLVFSFVFLGVMFYYSASLTLLAVLAIPIQLLINLIGAPQYRKRLQEAWDANAENNAFLVEAMTGVQTIKSLAVEPQFNFRWERLAARNVATNLEKVQLSVVMQNAANFTQKLFSYLIIWYGGMMVIDGNVTLGQFIAFQMLTNQANAPLLRLLGMWQSFQQTKLAMMRIGDVLNAVPEPAYGTKREDESVLHGAIELADVSFRYELDAHPALRKVNLKIAPGMKVGIVGRSGSGKSTLSKILQRLYLPESGKLYIDGKDMAGQDPSWLRRQIGVVQQENYLFNGSIRDNIAFARQGTRLEAIIHAAKLAGAHEFICELPDGYDTIVGERGNRLSGGQAQRIAIARALLSEPKILIFDEATSALDYQSERSILDNVAQLAAGRTMLMIAHRLANVVQCDRIIVMDGGAIAEQGTHEELMRKQGLYHNLYKQQGEQRHG